MPPPSPPPPPMRRCRAARCGSARACGSTSTPRSSGGWRGPPRARRATPPSPSACARATSSRWVGGADLRGPAGWLALVAGLRSGWLAGVLTTPPPHHIHTPPFHCLLASLPACLPACSPACPSHLPAPLPCQACCHSPLPSCLPACLPASAPALQIINVDDNTVAFAQWGLGTMGPGGLGSLEELEELPDTVVSKKSRHSCTAGLPPSAGKTPGACWRAGGRGWVA